MNKEQLKHIFENSACLSPKQLRMYASGKMVHEEAHAAEMHLLSCPLCNDAVEGLMEANKPEAFKYVEKQDTAFLAQHIDLLTAQEELNKDSGNKKMPLKAPTAGSGMPMRRMLKPIGIAAGVLLIAGVFWFMRDSIFPEKENVQVAQNTAPAGEPVNNTPEVSTRPADTLEQTTPVVSDSSRQLLADATILDDDNSEAEAQAEEPLKETKKEEQPIEKKKKEVKEELPTKNTASTTTAATAPNKKAAKEQTKKEPVSADAAIDKYDARMGNSFNADEKKEEKQAALYRAKDAEAAPEPPKKKIELGRASSGITKGDEAFNEGKYKKALRQYQKIMFDPQSNQKDAATLMAAKCHIAMEEQMQARTLLNSLIKENSSKKGEASGLLNKLGE